MSEAGEEDRIAAVRLSAWACGLVALGEAVFAMLDLELIEGLTLPVLRAAHCLFAVAALGWLVWHRERAGVRAAVVVFALVALPLVPVFWLAEERMLTAGRPWGPFIGHKLVLLGGAMLAPGPLVVGGALIATFTTLAVVQWLALTLGEHPLVVAAGEPELTLFYALVAIGLLAYRQRQRQLEQRYRAAREEAAVLEQLARVGLALRDAANTPLQTLELSLALLERQRGEDELLQRMKSSTARLRLLSGELAPHEPSTWERHGESFEAARVMSDASKRPRA